MTTTPAIQDALPKTSEPGCSLHRLVRTWQPDEWAWILTPKGIKRTVRVLNISQCGRYALVSYGYTPSQRHQVYISDLRKPSERHSPNDQAHT